MGHRGGSSETSLWALRTDLNDAFCDDAPRIDVALDADDIRADVVVMLAGRTLSTDPSQTADRAQLGAQNRLVFEQYAEAICGPSGSAPVVIVQSNPVEMGVQIFSDAVGRHRVIGAGAWSDTLHFALNWHGPCDSAEPTSRPGPWDNTPITWCPAGVRSVPGA